MRRLILSLLMITILCISPTFGQWAKGTRLIGGTGIINISSPFDERMLFVSAAPQIGEFVHDHIAVGAGMPLLLVASSGDVGLAIGLKPFVRPYVYKGQKTALFCHGEFGVLGALSLDSSSDTDVTFSAKGGLGISFQVSQNVCFETTLTYQSASFDFLNMSFGGLTMDFGFQIYLEENGTKNQN